MRVVVHVLSWIAHTHTYSLCLRHCLCLSCDQFLVAINLPLDEIHFPYRGDENEIFLCPTYSSVFSFRSPEEKIVYEFVF